MMQAEGAPLRGPPPRLHPALCLRQSERHAMASPWRIELFGGLRLSHGERSFAFLQAPKAGLLLAYLAYFPRHPQPRELLLELLWPETDPDTSRPNLRPLVHAIRRQLDPAAPPADPLLL